MSPQELLAKLQVLCPTAPENQGKEQVNEQAREIEPDEGEEDSVQSAE